ncbi:MAG: hypothetical protein AAFP22_14415 [Planctomycetota bacterium]
MDELIEAYENARRSEQLDALGQWHSGRPRSRARTSASNPGVPRFAAAIDVVSLCVGAFQPPGSQGTLCLGGAIGRFNGPGEILDSREFGRVRLDVDLGALPGGPGGQARAGAGSAARRVVALPALVPGIRSHGPHVELLERGDGARRMRG